MHDQSKALMTGEPTLDQGTQQERRTAHKGRAGPRAETQRNMQRASLIQAVPGGKNTRDDPKLITHLLRCAKLAVAWRGRPDRRLAYIPGEARNGPDWRGQTSRGVRPRNSEARKNP